ncbi:hypothetical protein B566_EDAN002541 [Ephemera danica]|nr:hypothetical protein B566_EDAN002541 [Ephemera danica]
MIFNMPCVTILKTISYFSILHFVLFLHFIVPTVSVTQKIRDDGQYHFNSILKKSELPDYGSCWNEAIYAIKEGCSRLTEITQSTLALMITDCFMEMSGEEKLLCANLGDLADRQKCIKNMPDRAFHVYTEFYTHAQNICFFLKSFVWQEHTEQTIGKLASISHVVQSRLEDVRNAHESLLENQKQSLSMQQDLVQHGALLGQILQERTTQEQATTLNHLAAKLSALQAWAIGEVSWLESVIYYVVCFAISYLMTSIPRTEHARLYVYIILFTGLSVEQLSHRFFLADRADQYSPMFLKQNVNVFVTFLKRQQVIDAVTPVSSSNGGTFVSRSHIKSGLRVALLRKKAAIVTLNDSDPTNVCTPPAATPQLQVDGSVQSDSSLLSNSNILQYSTEDSFTPPPKSLRHSKRNITISSGDKSYTIELNSVEVSSKKYNLRSRSSTPVPSNV